MKRFAAVICAVTLLFLAAEILWLKAVPRISENRVNARSVTVNRLNDAFEKALSEGTPPDECIRQLLGTDEELMPDDILFVPADGKGASAFTVRNNGGVLVCPVYDGEQLSGFAEYVYTDPMRSISDVLVTASLAFCWLCSVTVISVTYLRILRPFRRLSEYPERLAKMPDTDKLPETAHRSFGKFVWSMNMLRDVLISERDRAERLEGQRRTLLASVAHGVKTPVANIRLYAEAIKTGLYSGKDGDNTELAEKIDRNAEKIQSLVAELIDTSASAVSSFTPEISSFYLSELSELISSEYSERMSISRIPFSVVCPSDRMMNSDFYGIVRIISQLIENAVKYGDGGGITAEFGTDPDGVCISVRNKGPLLPEQELVFIFDSFRRGSNSHGVEGSGIGLFTAKSIANSLGGSICARRLEDTSEMEFAVYIPD